jgi:hypothetical protein
VPESGKPLPLTFYVPCAKSIAPLCLTALPSASVEPPYRMRGTEGLPPLPDLEFVIYENARPDKAAAALSADAFTGTITPGDLR